ncbi:MAG: hypothetical protein AAGA18_13900 [Verrucomicrobiota bacterium]
MKTFRKITDFDVDEIDGQKAVVFLLDGSDVNFLEWLDEDGSLEETNSHLLINQSEELRELGYDVASGFELVHDIDKGVTEYGRFETLKDELKKLLKEI